MKQPTASAGQTTVGQDWTGQAACRDADPKMFTDATAPGDIAQALTTCADCPVARDCLETALAHDQIGDIGIWGGTTQAVRDQIRAGTITRDDALHLQTGPYRQHPDRTPTLAVAPDVHGSFIDDTGRVLISRLPAGDYMAFVDQHPVARTPTLIDACQAAHTARRAESAAQRQARHSTPELVDVHLDEHGDHIDDSGRILITRVPTEPPYLVFLDNRLHTRTETLNTARAAAHTALHTEARTRDLAATPRTSAHAAKSDAQHPSDPRPAHLTPAAQQPELVERTR